MIAGFALGLLLALPFVAVIGYCVGRWRPYG